MRAAAGCLACRPVRGACRCTNGLHPQSLHSRTFRECCVRGHRFRRRLGPTCRWLSRLEISGVGIEDVLQVRGQQVLLDRDVAALYGVETRVVNQAVKNNPGKFPSGYVVELTQEEIKVLRSKILTLETTPGKESVRRFLPRDRQGRKVKWMT